MPIATLTIDLLARMASLERDMGRAAHVAEQNAAKIDKAFKTVGKTIAGVISAEAVRRLLVGFKDAAIEVTNLSQVSGTTAEQFQRMAFGARQFGVEQDKLADIFKDTQDKVGEFLQTGGGPLKDFFEQISPKVGVTVEQFARLSGPEALQLYYDSLQKANLGQKQTTFYLEAIASDASLLTPLLRDNGRAWQQLGDEAERFGAVLSDDAIKSGIEFNRQIEKLTAQATALSHQIAAAAVPALTDFLEQMTEGAKIAGGFGKALLFFGTMNPASTVADLREEVADLEKDLARFDSNPLMNLIAPRSATEGLLEITKKRLEFAELLQRQNALADAGDNRDPRDRIGERSAAVGGNAGIKPGGEPKGGKKQKEGDPLADAAKAYAAALEAINKAQLDADKSTRELNGAQSALFDLMSSPQWAQMPEPWRQVAVAQAGAASEAINAAAEQNRLNELLAATPTAQQEKLTETMQFLARQFEAGRISAEQFSEAAGTALGTLPDDVQKASDAMTVFAEQAARNMQDIFADYLFDGFSNGLDGMLKDFGVMLQKMIAQAVAADLMKRLMGSFGGGEGIGGAIASAFGGARASGGPVHAGTTYLVGERGPEMVTMPRDGYVTPNHALGGTQIINVTVNGGGNSGEVRRAAGQGARQALAALSGAQRYA